MKIKRLFLLVFLSCLTSGVFAQQKEEAEKLVKEGIAYHDKGDYDGAIDKYNKALEKDNDNLMALSEKALTLLTMEKPEEAILVCQKAIAKHPGEKGNADVYTAYGNALDALNKTDQSLEIYEQGIRYFPGDYELYFNKGVTLSSVKKFDEAILCFQKSVSLKPEHGSSHNGLARMLAIQEQRIPSLLAFCRFLAVEPQSGRAKENLVLVQKLMNAGVEKTGKNSISVMLNADALNDTTADGKLKENSFQTVEMMLSLTSALDYDKKNKNESDVKKFQRKLESVCASLGVMREKNSGFYWDYYVPYFLEMNEKKLMKTYSYIAFAASEDEEVMKWLKKHETEIKEFYEWSEKFQWKGVGQAVVGE